MMDADAILCVRGSGSSRRVQLSSYLDPVAAEDAAHRANAWIKSLRHARVDGVPFRERFTYRQDSLWWFAELYLHKVRTVLSIFRSLNAASALFERETPATVRFEEGGGIARLVIAQLARARGISYEGPGPVMPPMWLVRMDARSTALMLAAMASPGRRRRVAPATKIRVAAFVHRAFWRADLEDGSGESYIGPVLHELERQLPAGSISYVGLGPTRNFRARRWWRPAADASRIVRPIEQVAPRTALAGSAGIWAARHAMRRALMSSDDLRGAAVIGGCDCWPVLEEPLAGVAILQFPWSARAMDEAAAALEVLQPHVAVTYAEAGGWGRALALEARRLKIPLAGLQHGFIYRHWLNYLHEPDEMQPIHDGAADTGFPRPALTLVFDAYAARHLIEAGRFPPDSIAVTGSPRLDELAGRLQSLAGDDVEEARRACGAGGTHALALLVTKYTEAAGVLPDLLKAIADMPEARLAIKTHPAETPDPYEAAAAGIRNVRVLPASAPLAPLLRASQVVVTVNSTVALDAMALGIPALAIGLPNNLTPFVEAGAIAGASTADEIGPALGRLLYDDVFRQQFRSASEAVARTFRMVPSGGAARRQASMILELGQ